MAGPNTDKGGIALDGLTKRHLDIVILGGGPCDEAMRQFTGCEFRSQVECAGRRLGDIALAAARQLGRTVFVGPEGFEADITVPPGATFIESLRLGLAASGDIVLVVTADLPLLGPSHLQAFVRDWGSFEGVVYAVCSTAECQRVAPGLKRTCVKFREGEFTGGNVVGAPNQMLLQLLSVIEQGYAARKSPLRLARLVGGRMMGMMAMSRLTPFPPSVFDVGREAGRKLGCPVQILVTSDAEIATDIDSIEHLHALRNLQNPT